MTGEAAVRDQVETAGCAASAAHPRLPCLKKDNCIINGRYRSVFVAQENIRLYIWKFGEQNIGVLTVTATGCIEAAEFQRRWHSFLNSLRKIFPTGMWTRERQPRSGNWHAHAVVFVGFDMRTGFPGEQVARSFYANVDSRIRDLWKQLRESAESHGLGRIELLPLKHSGNACARYFTKYLTKSFVSNKLFGEEKCRLFGVWGGVRFVHPKFTFLSSRIVQKRKQWLAQVLGLSGERHLAGALGPRWWFHLRNSLSQVIMPDDFYKVGSRENRYLDRVGECACQADWPTWPEAPTLDLRQRSQFNLFYDVGLCILDGDTKRALRFAMNMVAKPEYGAPTPLDPQLVLSLEAAIERTKKNSSP